MTVDAEEAARLEPTLDVLDVAWAAPGLAGWDGPGIVVQAYQKRALRVIAWIAARARARRRKVPVRLVKGAYWDTEIKHAQEAGLSGYPVYTRKSATDLSYIACARALIAARDAIEPQFATHNAHTVAAVLEIAREAGIPRGGFEFQRLHGMGEALYGYMAGRGRRTPEGGHPVRIYAPVGTHEDLLPYLVRRLLENGANTSFVNRINDDRAPIAVLVRDPAERLEALERAGASIAHPRIPLPKDLFAPERRNSRGVDLDDPASLGRLAEQTAALDDKSLAGPLISGKPVPGARAAAVVSPSDTRRTIGRVAAARAVDVAAALSAARAGARAWSETPAAARADTLEAAATRMEADAGPLMALAINEGGKSVPDAVAELREAVDYCRFYAARTRADFTAPRALPGITGEANSLALAPRGIFACISPWNFPLAIFTGQVIAALAAGNAVIAKPAEETPLIAARAVAHLHAAGVPGDALALTPGGGAVGARLVADHRVDGVAFTGSTETARAINQALAARDGPIPVLIAETGGLNAMVVDSSALTEQVVGDVIASAFLSAGQRCSALRILLLQDDVADRVIEMLAGAMAELSIGDPAMIATDIGPVINVAAHEMLEAHDRHLARRGTCIARASLPADLAPGHWFPPVAYEVGLGEIPVREVFGPILHVVRFAEPELEAALDAVADTGYGLTLGIHSRTDATVARVRARLGVGNTYVNRAMTGAVVGSQPFGGEGLSGTGPKAGGPHYLLRFATERTLTVNTAAAGGNAALFASLEGPDPNEGNGEN
jgi:RHH-type proline utilization regulon transcriptional repressor/proline dehydrogenase/delta 1-pyrroline-5-carboxylate dehydrogenase